MLAVLFLVTTFNYFDYYVIAVLLEPIKAEFRVSDSMLGFLSGLSFSCLYALAAFPMARWADVGNRRLITVLSLFLWSAMTTLCGMTRSFGQLVVARMGVALTEPGAAPPTQSLLVDYFPPAKRATAIAILVQGGSAAGYCVGIGVGGYVAATHGWRQAFLWAGVPGMLLALLAWMLLAEPRAQFGYPTKTSSTESIATAFRCLRSKRSLLWAWTGLVTFNLFGYGTSLFLPSFMIRNLSATLQQVSVTWGFIVAAAMLIGALCGGFLADKLAMRDARWYAWLPALSFAIAAPLYWITLSASSLWGFIIADFPAEIVLAIGNSCSFAAIHAVCGSPRRAMAVAITFFLNTLLGAGLGPLIAGILSDRWGGARPSDGLRSSLLVLVWLLLPAAAAMYAAGRALPKDTEY